MNSWLHKKQDLVYLLDSVANLSYNTWYIYIYIFYVNKVDIYIYMQKDTEKEREREREKKKVHVKGVYLPTTNNKPGLVCCLNW